MFARESTVTIPLPVLGFFASSHLELGDRNWLICSHRDSMRTQTTWLSVQLNKLNLNSNWPGTSFEVRMEASGAGSRYRRKESYESKYGSWCLWGAGSGGTLGCADQEASTSPWWHPRNQGSPLSQDLGVVPEGGRSNGVTASGQEAWEHVFSVWRETAASGTIEKNPSRSQTKKQPGSERTDSKTS